MSGELVFDVTADMSGLRAQYDALMEERRAHVYAALEAGYDIFTIKITDSPKNAIVVAVGLRDEYVS